MKASILHKQYRFPQHHLPAAWYPGRKMIDGICKRWDSVAAEASGEALTTTTLYQRVYRAKKCVKTPVLSETGQGIAPAKGIISFAIFITVLSPNYPMSMCTV